MASFSLHKIRVSTETLNQVEEILQKDSLGSDAIKDAIDSAVYKVWLKTCGKGEVSLLISTAENFSVMPKGEFSEKVSQLVGNVGPYSVKRSCRSWVGLSEGLYEIENHDELLPAAWFSRVVTPKRSVFAFLFLFLLLAINIIQSSALLLLLF